MSDYKIVEDAVKAMASAAVELHLLTNENVSLLKETFELAGRSEKLKYTNGQLLVALKELLRVDDDWHGSINSEMSTARGSARLVTKEAENG